jgi:hypothetical protein
MRMPIKLVELDIWLDERDTAAVSVAKGVGLGDGRVASDASSHLMGTLLEALSNPGALAPLTENLTLWMAACDHAQTCAMCRSGLAALASYIAIIRADGEASAATRLPAVASHLRGCPLCRRDVADALAALQSLAPDAP